MKLYNTIRSLLRQNPELRDSDRKLIWLVWEMEGSVRNGVMTQSGFLDSKSTETIRRTRQKVQESHQELQSSPTVKKFKDNIQRQKGTHVYREPLYGNY